MSSRLFALLVGINDYHPDSGVPSLKGCLQDISAIRTFLESIFSANKRDILLLQNEQATYREVIRQMGPAHLGKAGPDDLVLLVFCGHGAREKAPDLFRKYYPEGKNETLVCYDSRLPGHFDLADKELAVLVDRLSQSGAEVVLWMDCCHAGSVSRDFHPELGAVRQWTLREDDRPAKSYLDGYFTDHPIPLPASRHISLAACAKTEQAYELKNNSGLFSSQLLSILKEEPTISYARLFTEGRRRMFRITDRQQPQFDLSGFFNPYRSFLSKEKGTAERPLIVSFERDRWRINCGALQGLEWNEEQPIRFDLRRGDLEIGTARLTQLGMQHSTVEPQFMANARRQYEARLQQAPTRLAVKLEASKEIGSLLTDYPAVYFQWSDAPADYRLKADKDSFQLFYGDQLIRTLTGQNRQQQLIDITEKLEKIGFYERIRNLQHTDSGLRSKDAGIELALFNTDRNEWRTSFQDAFDLELSPGQQQPFQLSVMNHSREEWYFALLYLSPDFGIHPVWNDSLPPKSKALVMERNPQGQLFAFDLLDASRVENYFLLLVSGEKVDSYLMQQQGFPIGEEKQYSTTRSSEEDRLAAPRLLGLFSGKKVNPKDDWRTWTTQVTLHQTS
jgi:hypothetical protein